MEVLRKPGEGNAIAEQYRVRKQPYYKTVADEESLYEAAYARRMPVMLKGPTGCGKSRFVEHMAYKLGKPLVTVACNEDMTASDLVGRYLLDKDGTKWQDGPLTTAARIGAICYLDEVVEARKDTTVVIHPLADDRRELPIEKKGELLSAPPEFMLAISYNPGYQSVLKDLKQSTRQRFISLEFSYPSAELETDIICHETGLDLETGSALVRLAAMTRNLKDEGLPEGASTRLLIHAGKLIISGMDKRRACRAAVTETLTDETELLAALNEIVNSIF